MGDVQEENLVTAPIIEPTVYVTGAGDCYHSSEECRDLDAGQKSGQAQGYEVRPIVEMSLSEAVAKCKKPCGTCGGTP